VRDERQRKQWSDAEGGRAVGEDQRQGRAVLTGRLGGVKVLVMENRDRKTDDDPSHSLFFVEATDRR
jgi:hypothetical protein